MKRNRFAAALLALTPVLGVASGMSEPLQVERALVHGNLAAIEGPEANAFAELLRHRAGLATGDPSAFAQQLTGSNLPAWRAAGLQALAEWGATPVGLDPAAALLLRPLSVAAAGRCEGFEALRDAANAASAEQSVLLARAESRCGAYRSALLRIAGVIGDRAPDNPSVPIDAALIFGETQARLGDDDSAALWCGAAAARASGVPSVQHAAAGCAAAADARRGVLPAARDRYIGACEAAAAERWLPPRERIAAALSGAWSLLRSDVAERSARATALLKSLESLPDAANRRSTVLPLLALAALARARIDDATALLSATPVDPAPASALLLRFVGARLAEGNGSGSTAQVLLESVAKDALAAKQFELALAAATDAARIAQTMAQQERARTILLTILPEIPRAALDRGTSPLVDPAVIRRAWQLLALNDVGSGKSISEEAASELLENVEWLRLRLAGETMLRRRSASVDTTRRFLASEDGALLAYMIGETQTFLWRVEPTGVVFRRLPAGDELFRIAGPLARGEDSPRPDLHAVALHGGLAYDLSVGATLLVLPDGFLYGVPWGALPPPPDKQDATGFGDAYDTVVAPSLRSICAPVGLLARDPDQPLGFLGLVPPRDGTLPDPGARTLRRFDRYERVSVTASALKGSTIVDDDAAVLHVSLPLIAATFENDPLFGVSGEREAGALSPLRLSQTYRERIPDLITISPASGPMLAPASRVRAAALAVERGSRSAIVALHGHTGDDAAVIWGRLYADLALGRLNTQAVGRLARREEEQRAIGAHGLIVVGRGTCRIVEPEQPRWQFWLLMLSGSSIVAIAIWRMRRRTTDPFAFEPLDEA